MILSKQSIEAIHDLIENRLAMMAITDQDDLRNKIVLQRALHELHETPVMSVGILNAFNEIPRRGRRRKIAQMA